MPYRRELKYLIDPFAYLALSKRIAPLIKRDDQARACLKTGPVPVKVIHRQAVPYCMAYLLQ